ncbi:hypothetical protein [Filimonas effusa]|uniref:Uncharacterized protein n=1 Tax=Filimonas effusa TaxID=2508721 RepID=A0A4Q1DC18_9BACT|nr:hypothetical protein [Filimonas effusa]RXK86997.1 hypothetical protein ESB13_09505 [Filimonas effusa]
MKKHFCIASRLNNSEFLILKKDDRLGPGPMCYDSVEKAKGFFQPFYHILSTENIDSEIYRTNLATLATIFPVIVAFNINTILEELVKWRDGELVYTSQEHIVPIPHFLCPMKKGFIEKYLELDIFKDIESISRIAENGDIEVSSFKIHRSYEGEKFEIDPLTEEKAIKILNRKGPID